MVESPTAGRPYANSSRLNPVIWSPDDNFPVHGKHRVRGCRCHQLVASPGPLGSTDWAKRVCKRCQGGK